MKSTLRIAQVLSLASALLSPVLVRAQSYECHSSVGVNCRTALNDAIARNGSVTVGTTSSTLLVTPGACPPGDLIVDVDLSVDVVHTYVGDLEMALVHPDGTAVTVLYRPGIGVIEGNCPSDDLALTFDQEDGIAAHESCARLIPAMSGTVLPFNPLSTFYGKPRNGHWTLRVSDHATGEVGALRGWSLHMPCVPDLPDVTVDAPDNVAAERGSGDSAHVTFTRTGSTDEALELRFVVTGTASLSDFEPLPETVTIPAGESVASLEIHAVRDDQDELDETVIITAVATKDYELGARDSATVTLRERSLATTPDAGTMSDAGNMTDAGDDPDVDAGADAGDAGVSAGSDDDGCSCRVAGAGNRTRPSTGALMFGLALFGLALRRRRR